MTELTWPKGLEPVYPFRTPIAENCSGRYCDQNARYQGCLLYTSDAADERSSVDLGGRRIIKKKTSVDLGGGRIINKNKKTRHTKTH